MAWPHPYLLSPAPSSDPTSRHTDSGRVGSGVLVPPPAGAIGGPVASPPPASPVAGVESHPGLLLTGGLRVPEPQPVDDQGGCGFRDRPPRRPQSALSRASRDSSSSSPVLLQFFSTRPSKAAEPPWKARRQMIPVITERIAWKLTPNGTGTAERARAAEVRPGQARGAPGPGRAQVNLSTILLVCCRCCQAAVG